MDLSNLRARQIATPLAIALWLTGIGGGVLGLANPLAFSGMIGIRVTAADSRALPFLSFAAARNLSSGIAGLVLLYAGQSRAAGLGLMAGATTALADAWICAKYGAEQGKAMGHAITSVVIAAVGGALYYGE